MICSTGTPPAAIFLTTNIVSLQQQGYTYVIEYDKSKKYFYRQNTTHSKFEVKSLVPKFRILAIYKWKKVGNADPTLQPDFLYFSPNSSTQINVSLPFESHHVAYQ